MTLLLGNRKGIWLVETECWCVGDDGDLTGTLHVLVFWLSPPPARSSLDAATIWMVWHSGSCLSRLLWKLVAKTIAVLSSMSFLSFFVFCCILCTFHYNENKLQCGSVYKLAWTLLLLRPRLRFHSAFVSRIMQKLLDRFSQNSMETWHVGHGRNQ